MSYRYARANGEFLTTKFVNPVASATTQKFEANQSYDPGKEFATGSSATPNSFTSDAKISGWAPVSGSLRLWCPLGRKANSNTSLVEDMSGHANWMTGSATGISYDDNGPSPYISSGSFLFGGSATLAAGDASICNFGTNGVDHPMSISVWVKPTSVSGWKYIIMKAKLTKVMGEWQLKNYDGLVHFAVGDNTDHGGGWAATVGVQTKSAVLSVGTWSHIVITYQPTGVHSTCRQGMHIYIDGVNIGTSNNSGGAGTYEGMRLSSDKVTIGNTSIGSTSGWSGNIADPAVFDRELTVTEVKQLYAAKNGAWKLVRNFEQASPDNDTRVLGISTARRGFDVSSWPADIMNQYVQGIYVDDFNKLLNYNAFRLRPNTSFIKTLRGRDLPTKWFDESIATTAVSSGSNVSHISIGGDGKISERLTNEREHRDLGQFVVYDNDEVFEDTLDLNPNAIISRRPEELILPTQLVCQTSNELTDGVIEPLALRERIDGSSIEGPFYSHEFRASLGGMTDAFRRSYVITDGQDLKEIADELGCAPFLDSVEQLGKTDMPGAFSDNQGKIAPYVDYLNDRDKEYTTNSVSSTVSAILIHSSSWTDNDDRTYDKMSPHGFAFDNDPIGFDSIAFGGLKK